MDRSHSEITDAKDDATIQSENEALLQDINRYCNRTDRTNVGNILLLGKTGAGKSSLINTLIRVIVGEYLPRARVGAGNLASNTLQLLWYKNCGVRLEDLQGSSNESFLRDLVPKLPNIFDWSGQCDENTDALKEKLKYLIGGYIKPETSITTLDRLQEKGGRLGTHFKQQKPEWKITKIVFVQSCQETVPKNLIKCLQSVLSATNEETGELLYDVDIFTVISRFDLVPNNLNIDHDDDGIEIIGGRIHPEVKQSSQTDTTEEDEPSNSDTQVSMEQFKKVETSLAKELNIGGALQYNSIRWISYVDRTGFEENHEINNNAFKFLKLMVMPGREKFKESLFSLAEKEIRNMWGKAREMNINLTPTVICWICVALFISVVLCIALSASPAAKPS